MKDKRFSGEVRFLRDVETHGRIGNVNIQFSVWKGTARVVPHTGNPNWYDVEWDDGGSQVASREEMRALWSVGFVELIT